ncbi:hypothetical protein NIIDMKKI_13950 [Mycobacterium kansasii]|uniref:Glucose-6-phosphate dehydrogenase NAD-binding domain-containing protein n=1 Tax=Mycobacterium kansasii TaxID=1768 RepID=A0A7G1I9J2_MYCKA|nr:hypothetical protein NIIDMKKI_13950 [Mycobacterium kansasii]
MAGSVSSASDVLVIFGITGDLARKMTFRALYRLERRGLLDCPIVGVASDDIPVDKLVERAREAIGQSGRSSTTRCSPGWPAGCPIYRAT